MLERVGDRVTGHAHALLHQRAARKLPRLLGELISDALARWAASNWGRFDELEINCTAQLYRWLIEAHRGDIRFDPLSIRIENVILTPGMMHGTEAVSHAARPDLRISVHGRGVFIEAKRLADTGDWCRKYVYEGIARFVASSYAADEELGMMVGYVQQPTSGGLCDRVNGYVRGHPLMGAGHELSHDAADTHAVRLRSDHTRTPGPSIRLDHVWVVLP